MKAVVEKGMAEAGIQSYIDYAIEVNEDRSINCISDGLKPVHRRVLWAMYRMGLHSRSKLVKAAKVIGDTMGNYHPHGDSSINGAMVTLATKVPMPMIYGSGNWGYFTGDPAGAARYIECKLSEYSDYVFFDPFYTPVIKTVNNYNDDPSYKEPIYLPTLLPNILINGVMGSIGVGVSSPMPSFTFESVIEATVKALKKGKATDLLCKNNLEPTNRWNGLGEFEDPDDFYKTGKGRCYFESYYEIDIPKKRLLIYDNLAYVNIAKAIEMVRQEDYVSTCSDFAGNYRGVTAYGGIEIVLSKNTPKGKVKETLEYLVDQYFSTYESYEMYTTHRTTEDGESVKRGLESTTPTKLLNGWIDYRIQLEKDACNYWIQKIEGNISNKNLLIKAVDQLEIIISALRKKFSKDQLRDFIAKKMKISNDDAEYIINLKVYQLRKLEKHDLLAQISELKKTIKEYKKRIKDPKTFIISQIRSIAKKLDA